MDKAPLLWHSNAPFTGTGYGTQTALAVRRLAQDRHLGISAFYGVEGAVMPYKTGDEIIPIYPALAQTYGNETIREHARVHFDGDIRAGLTVTLMDVWVLEASVWRQLNTACIVPIDHEPCPPPIAQFFRDSAAIPIAMSRFGQEQLRNAGLDPLYAPHGVDTSVYEPLPRDEAREALGLPTDAFIVGMVAANKGNPSRKCFPEAFEAFRDLRRRHTDAVLYLHTEMTGRFGGVDLPTLIEQLGIPTDAVIFGDQYRAAHQPSTPERMAQTFSAFDVLLQPSAGEGFGVPTIEAQACGTPVIVSDFSAQPELVGAGWMVEGQRTYTALKSWQFVPYIADIAEALHEAYGVGDTQRDKAREFALDYDMAKVYAEHLLPAIEAAEKRYADREPEVVIPLAQKRSTKIKGTHHSLPEKVK